MYPIKTVIKFYKNPYENSPNAIISRTLLKISVIDTEWLLNTPQENWPKEGEVWQVNITKEIGENQAKGCFIVEPIIHVTDIISIFPGMYKEETVEGILILKPITEKNINWMLPRAIKKNLKVRNFYAAIIQIY